MTGHRLRIVLDRRAASMQVLAAVAIICVAILAAVI